MLLGSWIGIAEGYLHMNGKIIVYKFYNINFSHEGCLNLSYLLLINSRLKCIKFFISISIQFISKNAVTSYITLSLVFCETFLLLRVYLKVL